MSCEIQRNKNRTSPWCSNIIINISIEQSHCHPQHCEKDGVIVFDLFDVGNTTFEPQANRNLVAQIWYIFPYFDNKLRETHYTGRVVIEVQCNGYMLGSYTAQCETCATNGNMKKAQINEAVLGANWT